MTAVSPVAFPNSRTVAGWWRQLSSAPARPTRVGHPYAAFWVAHLRFHRIEALVRVGRQVQLDRFTRLALEPFAVEPEPTLERVHALLPVGIPALRQLVRGMETAGLVTTDGRGRWRLTERGQTARAYGTYPLTTRDRHAFYFLESGTPDRPPHFLPLSEAVPLAAPSDWKFDVQFLIDSVRQTSEWKRRHGFPDDVSEIVVPAPDADDVEAWRSVILDQPQQLTAVFVLTHAKPGDVQLRGFSVQPRGWTLQSTAPVLELKDSWPEVFPELTRDPPETAWRLAWRAWATANGISAVEADACKIERREHRLRVTGSRALLDRLRAARNDPLKNEGVLLVGDDRLRAAATLEILTG